MNYLIDGYFLTEKTNGVQRFGYEILRRWDTYEGAENLKILVPEYYDDSKKFSKIQTIRYGSRKGKLWEQLDFPEYAKKHQLKGIYFTNTVPVLYRKGIVVLHDVIFKARPDFFCSTVRGMIAVAWRVYNYSIVARSKMHVVTVSEFSKSEIEKYYKISPDRISVVKNSWQHMDDITCDDEILKKANLSEHSYYFSMATIAKNKNFEWILSCARNNPSEQFVIAGGGDLDAVRKRLGYGELDNVKFLGYVSDEEAKSLMKNCKAFLFPTLYEGFGIPPLEAVACGAKTIIVSDTPCMHEIYGEFAAYINPLDFSGINLITNNKVNTGNLLKKYSWDKSAEELMNIVKNN